MVISGMALAAAICASMAPSAMIGVTNLVNGWRQRKFQKVEGGIQRDFSEKLQERQQKLQMALQERNFRESEKLQKELVALQFENAIRLQKVNFGTQLEMWEKTKFFENEWPLKATPQRYVEELRNTYSINRIPLQILVPGVLSENLQGLGRAIRENYALDDSTSPVFYYDGGWKDGRTVKSTALLSSLHAVLKGMPTLVLMPTIDRERFSLDIGFWGFGQLSRHPKTFAVIPKLNMKELEVQLIQAYADSRLELYADENEVLEQDLNVGIRRAELKRREELLAAGTDIHTIEEKLRYEFFRKYQKKGIEEEIEEGKRNVLNMVLEVVCAAFADIYHLLESKAIPKAPSLSRMNGIFADPRVRQVLVDTYKTSLSEFTSSTGTDTAELPLYLALVAQSLHDVGWNEEALNFARCAQDQLSEIYSADRSGMAISHIRSIQILSECNLLDSDISPCFEHIETDAEKACCGSERVETVGHVVAIPHDAPICKKFH